MRCSADSSVAMDAMNRAAIKTSLLSFYAAAYAQLAQLELFAFTGHNSKGQIGEN